MTDNTQALEVLDRVWNYCEEIDNHLPFEEKTGYRMIDDMNLLRNYISSSTKTVHGHWICENLGFGACRYRCSKCGNIYGQDQIEEFRHSKFCGDCGARMDGE